MHPASSIPFLTWPTIRPTPPLSTPSQPSPRPSINCHLAHYSHIQCSLGQTKSFRIETITFISTFSQPIGCWRVCVKARVISDPLCFCALNPPFLYFIHVLSFSLLFLFPLRLPSSLSNSRSHFRPLSASIQKVAFLLYSWRGNEGLF